MTAVGHVEPHCSVIVEDRSGEDRRPWQVDSREVGLIVDAASRVAAAPISGPYAEMEARQRRTPPSVTNS